MFFIHRMTARVSEWIIQQRTRMTRIPDVLTAIIRDGREHLIPWLLHILSQAEGLARTHWPILREQVTTVLRPEKLRARAKHIRRWMKEHDTVPPQVVTKSRERLMERLQRKEQRAMEREQHLEEIAKKREKKELEERQTYSVYFE